MNSNDKYGLNPPPMTFDPFRIWILDRILNLTVINPQTLQRFEGSILLSALLVEVLTCSDFFAIHVYGNLKTIPVFHFKPFHHPVIDFTSVLLTEFKKLAFIVVIFFFQVMDIEMAPENF